MGRETDPDAAVALNDELRCTVRPSSTRGLVLALAHKEPADERAGEFFGALLMIDAGAMVVASANESVFLFVGLELVSIPTYLLLYLSRANCSTQEAAAKYFFLSIFSSGLLLYGLTFLYGMTGVSNLKAIAFLFETLPYTQHYYLGLLAVVFVGAGRAVLPGRCRAPSV